MNSHHLRNKVGRILLGLAFVAGIGIASSTAVQAQYGQWPYGQDPYRGNRDYRRDDRSGRNGGYGNITQIAITQGYQDGINTGSRDGERRQNYNPQRSHFYRNGHGDNGGYGRIDNSVTNSNRPTAQDSCVVIRRATSATAVTIAGNNGR